jgi:hypothetical protein
MRSKSISKDISPSTIKKEVISTSLQKPFTVYPATVGALGAFYSLLFGSNIITLVAMIAGGSVTLFNWVYEYYIKGDQHANRFVTLYRMELEKRRIDALKHLEEELSEIQNEQAVNQVLLFRRKYDNFQAILDRKLDATELTYNRYLSIAEQVFLNGLDNLENAAIALKSISAINVDRIKKDIKALDQGQTKNIEAQKVELNARLELHKTQLNRARELLLTNEKALTQLDQVAAKLANIDTRRNHAHVDMEDAMDELSRLIERAEGYSN